MREIGGGLLFVFLILCSLSDIRTKRISTWLLMTMSGTAGLLWLAVREQNILGTAGGIGVGVLFCIISKCTKEAIGYGDSWILLILGGYLGWRSILELIMGAFFLAGVFSLAGIVVKRWQKTLTIPFVPFLTAAYIWVVMV